jgi:RHS repeat-associated protein
MICSPSSARATNNAANALTSWNASALTYDANGNLKTDAVHNFTYFWNARNELVEITNPGTLAKFTYDPFGRRISKEVIGRATVYLYDGNTVVRETGDVGTASTLSGLGTDEYLSRTVNGVVSYFLPDAIRSTVALTDANGTVTTQYTYEPFGATFVAGPPRANPFRFAGREDDGETDLYYYRARYYSPHFQRFISEDPLAHRPLFVSVPPAYRYALNNPLSLIDPDGLACYRAPPGVDPNELQYGLMGLGVGAIAGAVIGIVEEMVATAAALEEAPGGGMAPQLPSQDYPPGPGFEWRGDPEKGSWFNPDTGEYVRPDWNHDPSIPPHVDYRGPDGTEWRVFPNGPGGPPGGRWEPK